MLAFCACERDRYSKPNKYGVFPILRAKIKPLPDDFKYHNTYRYQGSDPNVWAIANSKQIRIEYYAMVRKSQR